MPDAGGWANSGTLDMRPPDYEDDEDKIDGLKRNVINSNGVVRIDLPSPLREEPRFPKEKLKTFIGELNTDTFWSVYLLSSKSASFIFKDVKIKTLKLFFITTS